MNNKPTYISLFSSAGIGCYGLKINGFECVATNEYLGQRMDVQRANNKCKYDSGYIVGDIRDKSIQQKIYDEIDMWHDKEGLETIDVVIATPPCQGMSVANLKKNEHDQIRNSLVVHAINIIEKIKPNFFIFENVKAFMKTICTDTDGQDKKIECAIMEHLEQYYNIKYKSINFKDYGVPSSRPRTLVIGVNKKYQDIDPETLFPVKRKEITLRQVIGDLRHLEYGEKDPYDFLHFARKYPIEQLNWIKNTKEGQSAFEQSEEFQPFHLGPNGEKIINKSCNFKNKYRRLVWDKPGSCILTRNDVFSSTDTIHPSDNRVLSIRELMRIMTIPSDFRWTNHDDKVTPQNSDEYLKKNERNIRVCIGEGIPTHIVSEIASKILKELQSR